MFLQMCILIHASDVATPQGFESAGRLGELPLTAQVGSPGEALLHSHPASFQNVYILNDISVHMYRYVFMRNFCNPQDDQRNSAAARPRGATDHHRATRQRCAVECRYFIHTHKYLCLYMYTYIYTQEAVQMRTQLQTWMADCS